MRSNRSGRIVIDDRGFDIHRAGIIGRCDINAEPVDMHVVHCFKPSMPVYSSARIPARGAACYPYRYNIVTGNTLRSDVEIQGYIPVTACAD